MKNLNPNSTLKHGPEVAFATKSNNCCVAMWRTINGLMKTLTLKHGPTVAFATKSNNCCAAMWRTINGLMKNPNPKT
jgi:hypothetical protein